jgi:hypothetical protein
MGETTAEIGAHIESKRQDLQSNLEELENRVRAATDWRQFYRKYTGTLVAAAFGAGVLVSALVSGSRSSGSGS